MVVVFKDKREASFGYTAHVSVDKKENRLYVETDVAVFEYCLDDVEKVDMER